MALEVEGKTIELDENGNLVNTADWTEEVAKALAAEDEIELTPDHWEVINYLRDEYFNNSNNQPMERFILKGMSKRLGKKVTSKDMYKLFSGAPSKQGNRIAGLPFVARKGGY